MDRPISLEALDEDTFDTALRPLNLSEFIGQKHLNQVSTYLYTLTRILIYIKSFKSLVAL